MRRSPAAPPQPGSKSVLPCVATVPKVREDTPMALDSIPDSSSCAEKFSREPRHSATALKRCVVQNARQATAGWAKEKRPRFRGREVNNVHR